MFFKRRYRSVAPVADSLRRFGNLHFLFLIAALWLMISVSVRAQTNSVVTVNPDNVLVINGKKVFVIGMSPGPPTLGQTPGGNDALQELRNAGALLFRINQTNDWNSQLIAQQQAALDWAEAHGMYIWLNLRELSEFASTDTNTPASLRNIVDTFRNHPALGLWKNYDEAWWSGVSVSNLYNGYVMIKQEDTNHPVVQTHAPRGMVSDLQPYNIAADVLAVDIYPVTASGIANNPPVTNQLVSQVGDWTDELAQVAGGTKEYWLIEQIAFSGTTPPGNTLVFPTFTQSRFMAYQAIIDGSRGLMFFGGNIPTTLNAQDSALGWNWTFWNSTLKPVVQQLGDKSLLANALVAPASTLPITMSGTTSPDIEFCVREAPPYVYILASKREGATVSATFSGLPSWASHIDVLYETNRSLIAQGGQFTDSFAPLDVHVYRFSQSNQSPSIIADPQSLTNNAGTTANFSATVDGTGPLIYQWQKNGANLIDGGNVSGSGTSSLNLANVSQTDAASYRVMVTGFGSVTSAVATLTVAQIPIITSQPQSRSLNAGSTATFSLTALGNNLTYQWSKTGTGNLTDGGNVSGSQTPTLILTGVTSASAGTYSATVSNAQGSVSSAGATLTVVYPMPYYEPFNYSAGTLLNGQTNPNYLSWADVGTSTSGPSIATQTNKLSVPGLMSPIGNCIKFGGLGKSARFSFPTGQPFTAGTLYFSFMLEVTDPTGLSTDGIFISGFNNSVGTQTGQPTVIGTRLYIRATNGGFNLGVAKNSSTSTDWVWDPRIFATNQVLFIVGSYTINNNSSSDDVSTLWINPAASTFGAGSPPAPALVATSGSDISGVGIASFVFAQRATNEPAAMLADELRIATSWADVTPPASSAQAKLGGLRMAGGGFQFSFTNNTGHTFSVYMSPDLKAWSNIGTATEVTPGVYQFNDPAANSSPRFYQLRSP